MAEAQDSKTASAPDRVPAPALVHVANSWLEEITARTRSRPIPWEGYARADLVSADELKLIKKVERQPRAKVDSVYDAEVGSYALLYLRLLAKLSRTDTLQQILVLVGDMLRDRDDRAAFFAQAQNQAGEPEFEGVGLPYGPFLKLLQVQDDFVQVRAAQYLTLLILSAPKDNPPSQRILDTLFDFLTALINTGASPQAASSGTDYAEGNGADIAIQLLEALLRSQIYRAKVWADEQRRQGSLIAASGEGAQVEGQQANRHVQPSMLKGLINILINSQIASYGSNSSVPASGSATPGSSSAAAESSSSSALQTPSLAALTNGQGASGIGVAVNLSAAQAQYQVILSFWLLSFDPEIAANLNVKFGVIPLLADVARRAVKEKVIRIIFSTFKNLLANAADANAPAMIGSRVLPLSQTLAARKWSDEDIEEDLKTVQEALSERLKWMSTYDEYVSELLSGELSWDNPAHELDDFWKKNAERLIDSNAENLKLLVGIIERAAEGVNLDDANKAKAPESQLQTPHTKEDTTSVAIALHDVRKFVQYFEPGKKRLDDLGAKVRIMSLMTHPDSEIKYQALNTVGVLLSASWRTQHVGTGAGSKEKDKA
ncbi:H(+)-transporting V1 sector ATPase subunit H [Tilletia horrida]|uniref:H(+)-transporting V1 sector ATPase subunit H n=1 Tax=Tilletia horrida TaxID=155126 RepID=A0AAN6GKF3_9BASI|nr:H(+)-transporting V1 sector ATPase subunit H [Tilletia horrida]KAK0561659.1 H(+)-transporting V1 sector ATPase subunit H [Tilletia horrida]